MFFVSGATHVGVLHIQRQVQRLKHFDRFSNNFGSDAVTGKNGDFHDECF